MEKICCGFGHSDFIYYDNLLLTKLLEKVILTHNIKTFFVCDMGNFDKTFSSCLTRLKLFFPDIKIILILPYYKNSLTKDKDFYERNYDEIIIPEISASAHYKAAISLRNNWMVDNSDVIISGVCKSSGGAYKAIKYAEKQNKNIINFFK